jgi:hypothetical protein
MAVADRANKMAIANTQAASALAVETQRGITSRALETQRATSAESLNTATLTSNEQVQAARNASQESIAKSNATAAAAEGRLDRLSRENVTKWNNESAIKLQQMKENFGVTSEYRSDATNAFNSFSNGVANIDITSSPESQVEQFNRVNDSYNERMNFLNTSRISDLAAKGLDATDTEAMEAYNKAIQVGMTATELDQLGGVPAGTAEAWVQSKGLQPLRTPK